MCQANYLRPLLCSLIYAALLSSELAAETSNAAALQNLSAMQKAMATQNFQGTVAILKNGKLDTLEYFHSLNKGVEQERLVSLNSPLREIIKENNTVSCLFKASQQILIDHKPVGRSLLLDLPELPADLEKMYSLTNEGQAEVAHQAALVLSLKPLDQYRYTRKYWIALDSSLPLKVEVQNFTGETLEQLIFTELHQDKAIAKATLSADPKNIHHIHEHQDLDLNKLPFELNNLPIGFVKRSFTQTHLHPSNKSVQQLHLSDGLSSVSVYLEKSPQNQHVGLQNSGAVNSINRIIDDMSIMVIGDVPAATVEFIAQGINFPNHK